VKNTDTSFSNERERFTLKPAERRDLRARITAYMEYHPLAARRGASTGAFGRFAKYIPALTVSGPFHFRRLSAVLAVLVFVAVPVVAEQSLPGETLYPVKVRFNEGLRAQLLFSPYEKMQWEAKRVERRIAEARLLANEGKLTAKTENTLEENIRSHTSAFREQLAVLRESDASNAAVAEVTFESALAVQTIVLNAELDHAAFTPSHNEGDIHDLVKLVEEAQTHIASSTAAGSAATYDALERRVAENIATVGTLERGAQEGITDNEKTETDARMRDTTDVVVSAKAAHEAGKEDEATTLLRGVLADTEKIIAFLSSFDLRADIALDTLVPPSTLDENSQKILARAEALLSEKYDALDAGIGALAGPRKTEALKQLQKLSALLKRVGREIGHKDFEEAERLAAEAETSISDLEKIADGT
jgi:hypothetical protein